MEQNIGTFIVESINGIGTLCVGVAAIIGVFKVVTKLFYKNEVLYGKEATERFESIEAALEKTQEKGTYPFKGSPNTITPQLKITRVRYNPQTMPPAYKGCTQNVRYIAPDENTGDLVEKVWWLK